MSLRFLISVLTLLLTPISLAYALTLSEMEKANSAIIWRESDHDIRRMDIEDYLEFTKIKHSDDRLSFIEKCMHEKLEPYKKVNVTDKNGPTFISLIKECSKHE